MGGGVLVVFVLCGGGFCVDSGGFSVGGSGFFVSDGGFFVGGDGLYLSLVVVAGLGLHFPKNRYFLHLRTNTRNNYPV